jgi:hypothetical protein
VFEREVETDDGVEEEDGTDRGDACQHHFGEDGEPLREDGAASRDGVGEYELEPSGVLLARKGARARADREHEDEERQHEAEELGVEEARAGGEISGARDAEEGLQNVGIALDQLVQLG